MNTVFKVLLSFVLSFSTLTVVYAEKAHDVIDAHTIGQDAFYRLTSDGWQLVNLRNKLNLMNFSNKNYMLAFALNCNQKYMKSKFLIEYTRNYQEGWGGVGFVDSEDEDVENIIFYIDGKIFANPFDASNRNMKQFKTALQQGKVMKIQFDKIEDSSESTAFENGAVVTFGTKKEVMPGKHEATFQLKNGELLDVVTNCT